MKRIFNIIYALFSLLFIAYLALPTPDFPEPPEDVFVSIEPADVESELRRGYYTNFEREEAILHYMEEFKSSGLLINFPTYRLNYPPEEAQVLIRDQTRSTYLEEIVHPFRESLYVNGFKPTRDNESIIVNDERWNQKIIAKMVFSNTFIRIAMGTFTLTLGWILIKEYVLEVDLILNKINKLKK